MNQNRMKPTARGALAFVEGQEIFGGQYKVQKILAQAGGMSNVYLVMDTRMNSIWVLKQIIDYRIHDGKVESGEMTQREYAKAKAEYESLHNEAQIMSKLRHTGIPRITNKYEDKSLSSVFLLMDYVEGASAAQELKGSKGGAIPEERAVKWMLQLSTILGHLHGKGIFYRDLKPDNIMIKRDGVALIDFGISVQLNDKNTVVIDPMGSRGYASPEQAIRGARYDLRSDIYSFGVTLYHMLTGISPLAIHSDTKKPYHEPGEPFSLEGTGIVSPGLDTIIKKCTQPDPELRYQSIEEVTESLLNYKQLDEGYRRKQRRKITIVKTLLVAGVVVGLSAAIPWYLSKNADEDAYNRAVTVAGQSVQVEDYIKAIEMQPKRLAPYSGLFESIKEDGKFTPEEEKALLGIVNPNIIEIRDQENYGKIAHEIGKLYWFYYAPDDGGITSNTGKSLSTKWFRDSADAGYEKELSEVYYNFGEFDKNIASASQEASDAGMYKKYWDNLQKAQATIDGNEVLTLQLYNASANFLSNYAYRLKSDGVKESEVLSAVDSLEKYLAMNEPSPGVATDLFEELEATTQGIANKIELAYREVQ